MTDTASRTLPVKYTKAQKARLQRDHEKRIHNEQVILDAARSGASLREISRQTGFSVTHVRRLWASAMDRPGDHDVAEFKAVQTDRLGRLLFATWGSAMENEPRSVRNALRIIQELNRMEPGIYPSAKLDITGNVTVTDLSTERIGAIFGRLQAQATRRSTLALEAGAVDGDDSAITARPVDPGGNGHASYIDAEVVDPIDDPTHGFPTNGHNGATE